MYFLTFIGGFICGMGVMVWAIYTTPWPQREE